MKDQKKTFTLKEKIAAMGPGFLIVGSFIGPGTVTSSTRAGAANGLTLFWCVLFSVIAVIVVQGMSARIGSSVHSRRRFSHRGHSKNVP